jgi:hypothetical protein
MASLWHKMKLLVNSQLTNLAPLREKRGERGEVSADNTPARPGGPPVATAFTPEEAHIFVRFLADQNIPATLTAADPATGHIAIHTAAALAPAARAALHTAGLIPDPLPATPPSTGESAPEATHDQTSS